MSGENDFFYFNISLRLLMESHESITASRIILAAVQGEETAQQTP